MKNDRLELGKEEGFEGMEKLKRELKELGESNARLGALIDYLANEKKLMASKSNHIFMLDMQDYVAALNRLAPSDSKVSVTLPEIKQINRLLTQQYELMKLVQRDYARLEVSENPPEDLDFEKKKKKHLRRLQIINQLLLQDNIFFQSMLDAKKISGNIRIGEKKNWLQRLLRKKRNPLTGFFFFANFPHFTKVSWICSEKIAKLFSK